MQDRAVSLSLVQRVIAYTLFVAGVVLIGLNFRMNQNNDHLGFAAVPVIALSMILVIRVWFCRMAGLVKETQGLLQDAYNVGREVGREESSGVRPLR